MEVKVFVDGVPRVVCGVTEETTCQDVVIALAQAIGQPGRYTLQETFKDFERCMFPGERLLDVLEKYGEQAREVRLKLRRNGPSVLDEACGRKAGRYQPCPPLRRKDAGARTRRGSGSLSLHRQSLPPLLPCSRQEAEQQRDDPRKPKRKSLTLMEEAWEWLESLGKGMVYSTAADKEGGKKNHKRNSLDVFLVADGGDDPSLHGGKGRGQKGAKSDLDQQTTCCLGSQTRPKESRRSRRPLEVRPVDPYRATSPREDAKAQLRETIVCQLSCLEELQLRNARADAQLSELEGKQRARRGEQEARKRLAEEEMEQIRFWANELKAEEGYEKDLERQFLEMKAKALECKARLEEYKRKLQGLNSLASRGVRGDAGEGPTDAAASLPGTLAEDDKQRQSDPDGNASINRKLLPREDGGSSPALLSPGPIRERRPTGPTELREWWARWSEAQRSQPQAKKKVVHRSELTIYLGSTKV